MGEDNLLYFISSDKVMKFFRKIKKLGLLGLKDSFLHCMVVGFEIYDEF